MNTAKIRNYINYKKGCRIIIKSFQSRNREEKYEGIILNTYKNVFTVELENGYIKSFTYVDILIKNIRVYI